MIVFHFILVSNKELGAHAHFACGLVAGLLASLVTHPADVIKTQMQLYPSSYRSTRHCMQITYVEYGKIGFFRGIVPRCLRRTLISAFSWTVFEELMKIIKSKAT